MPKVQPYLLDQVPADEKHVEVDPYDGERQYQHPATGNLPHGSGMIYYILIYLYQVFDNFSKCIISMQHFSLLKFLKSKLSSFYHVLKR